MNRIAEKSDDRLLYDIDGLKKIASENIIRRGVAYFKENRVTELDSGNNRIWATVEGSQPDEPYFVELAPDNDGELLVDCNCPFEWEPVCKHAVAVLLAYDSLHSDKNTKIKDAADEAVAARAKRGRTEVRVTHVSGDPSFGTWRAKSISSTFARSYDVQIRSLEDRKNFCTCPDHATNFLGTCKHIEAVLHRLKKRPKKDLRPATVSFVYLAWDVAEAPKIKLHRAQTIPDKAHLALDAFFHANGIFKGALPESFFRFEGEIREFEEITIGEDVQRHVRRLAEQAAQALKGQRIEREINGFGGQLPGIRARLYPYQTEGVSFLASNGRALLADDMGLGKTLQAIAAASWLMQNESVRKTLIVCPASLKTQWAREIAKFTDLTVQVIQGSPAARLDQYRARASFFVINYELILRDVAEINRIIGADLLIFDEAQRVKNWRTKIAASIRVLESRYLFVLTGTPLENRLEDLYSLIQLVDPRVLGPLWRFFLDFHVTNDRGRVIGYRNLSVLRRRIEPVMLRRDRRLVSGQLPDRIEHRRELPLSQRQKMLHDSGLQAAQTLAQIMKKRPLTPSEEKRLMAGLQQARMACNAAGLVDGKTEGSPKLEELAKLFEELCLDSDLKVVVFSQWEKMTAMAEAEARKLGLGAVRLHGGVPTKSRGKLLDKFRDDPATRIFFSTDAGGVGLNLQNASVLINLDMPWNPAVLDQRIARVHRLGQKEKVQIIMLISSESYEMQVTQLIENKRELFDNVVDPDASEDVVGVSKRNIALLLEMMDEPEKAPSDRDPVGPAQDSQNDVDDAPETKMEGRPDSGDPALDEEDAGIRRTVETLQRLWGVRLERVLGVSGSLLAVVDRVDQEMEAQLEAVVRPVPIAMIDSRSFFALRQLGEASPLAGATSLVESPTPEPETSPFIPLAIRKLKSAEILHDQGCPEESAALAVDSMLAAVAGRARLDVAPTSDEAPVWLFTRGLEQGLVSLTEATALAKALSLSRSTAIPESLATEILADARKLLGTLTPPEAVEA